MLDLAFAAGSVSVFASVALVPHAVSLASLFLTWVKSLFGRKPAAGEQSGLEIDLDWQSKRFRVWSTRGPAPSGPSSGSPSSQLTQQLPPIAAGCERLPQPPIPVVSEPEPILLHFPPPGHVWTVIVDPESASASEGFRIRECRRRGRRTESSSNGPKKRAA